MTSPVAGVSKRERPNPLLPMRTTPYPSLRNGAAVPPRSAPVAGCLRHSARVLLAAALLLPLRADEVPEAPPSEPSRAPAPLAAAFRFPDIFLDGTQPPPAPARTGRTVPQQDILQSRRHSLGGRTVTVRKVRPIDLPPIPEPQSPPRSDDPEVLQIRERLAGRGRDSAFLLLGATVYSSSAFPGQTRTLLTVSSQRTGASFQCWSSAPWHHIAGAFTTFEGPQNRQYALIMNSRRVDLDCWGDFLALRGIASRVPDIPAFAPQDRSSFVLPPGAETPPPEDLAPLQAIHDLCRDLAALEKLRSAWESRELAKARQEAARRAAPPEKKDILLNTFRLGGAPVTTPAAP